MKTLTLDAKSFLASVAVLALLGMAVGVMAVQGATTSDVAATVTAQLVSVSVADGAVAYGILGLGVTKDTTNTGVDNTQTATNDGNVAADFGIRSSDAVGGDAWNLAVATGTDAFVHDWCTVDCDGTPIWNAFDEDNVTYSSLASGVATSTGQAFDLRIHTPSAVSDNVLKTITVTVQATAS